jgi:hypothetical protein
VKKCDGNKQVELLKQELGKEAKVVGFDNLMGLA